jgi:hypothetical protein
MAVVFFSYSHADADLRLELERHLAALRRQNLAEGWHDGKILAGDELDPAILANLERADVILLLVSSDFINSDYCYCTEMGRAFERHAAGEARVIPVILRDCDWQHPPISKVLVTPKDGKPVTSWMNKDEAFADVARQVRKAIEEMNTRNKRSVPSNQAGTPGAVANTQPSTRPGAPPAQRTEAAANSSLLDTTATTKLRIRRKFSDFDRDEFVHSSFEHIAGYFETSLLELVAANDGIKQRFQRIDARRFTATIYSEGKSVSECTIRIDSMGGRSPNLAFSYNANAADGSSNEMLFIEHDGHELYYKPLGMASYGQNENNCLDAKAAAQYLWDLLTKRLGG